MNKSNDQNTITLNQLYSRLHYSEKDHKRIDDLIHLYDLLHELRDQRKTLGLSQEEVAKKAGITRPELSKIESGKRNATLATLMSIAQAMNKQLEIRLI